jgi:hypothetical protein
MEARGKQITVSAHSLHQLQCLQLAKEHVIVAILTLKSSLSYK